MQIAHLKNHPEYLPTIAAWHFNEWHELYPQETQESFAADLKNTMLNGVLPSTWLLMAGGEVLGTASILQQDLDSHRALSPWLANVFIRPDQRGRGLGRYLLDGVLQRAREGGLKTLYLFTEDQMTLYQRLGFEEIEQNICNGKPIVIMAASL